MLYTNSKPTLQEVKATNEFLAKQLTDANKLLTGKYLKIERKKVLKKAQYYLHDRGRVSKIAGMLLMKMVATQRPYNEESLTLFANRLKSNYSDDIKYHGILAFADTIKIMADDGFISNKVNNTNVKTTIEFGMYDTMRTPSENSTLIRCAAVRALGILQTELFYSSMRNLLYADSYSPDNSPNLALVDASASALCIANPKIAFDDLADAYAHANTNTSITKELVDGTKSLILCAIYSIMQRPGLDPIEVARISDFLSDCGYFNKSDAGNTA